MYGRLECNPGKPPSSPPPPTLTSQTFFTFNTQCPQKTHLDRVFLVSQLDVLKNNIPHESGISSNHPNLLLLLFILHVTAHMSSNSMAETVSSIATLLLIIATTCSAELCEVEENKVSSAKLLSTGESFQRREGALPRCTSPWTYCANTTCKCGTISEDILQCRVDTTSTLSHCYCVTFDTSTGVTTAGNCVYTCAVSGHSYYHILPNTTTKLDEQLCSPFNRTGTLCGKCEDGLHPLAYSFDMNCVECPHSRSNWWKFVLAAFLPLTVFFFVVLFFNINVTSSHFHSFIWFSQGIAIPALVRIAILALREKYGAVMGIKILLAAYGIWNLDFFRSLDLGICLEMDTLQTLALDLAVGVYPLSLLLLTYVLIRLYDTNFKPIVILWKPFHAVFGLFRRNWEVKTSLIDAFSTFFLLSNVKFLSVSFDLLVPVKVYQFNSTSPEPNHTWRLFYDANVPYLGQEHLPYAILAIIALMFYVVLPTLLVTFYPFKWFQKMLNLLPVRWYVLHTFMDTFQGCYKDGTQPGTRDCRWFISVFFTSRLLLMAVGGYTLNAMFYPLMCILITVVIILMVNIQPFKDSYATINTAFITLLGLCYVAILGVLLANNREAYVFYAIAVLIAFLPLLYVSGLIVHWLYIRRNFGTDLVKRIHTWRQGYELLL